MKLKKAAQTTACPGDKTRVDTTVATELAASWNPLMKSNTRAIKMIDMANRRMGLISTVFDHHSLEHIGHVFAAIGGIFQELVHFLQLHEGNGIFLIVEEIGDGAADDAVGHILEAVDFDAVLGDLLLV